MKCPHCGSEAIQTSIPWSKAGDANPVGLAYKNKIFTKTAAVYSDLCLECGTIIRSYIKESTNKDWMKF